MGKRNRMGRGKSKEEGRLWETVSLSGSMTVEASLLMGGILLVIVVVLHLFFYVHNRAYLTCAAYESALSGAMAAVTGENTYMVAYGKSRELARGSFYGTDGLQAHTDISMELLGERVTVSYEAETRFGFGLPTRRMYTEGNALILEPVKWIRRTKAVADMLFQSAY